MTASSAPARPRQKNLPLWRGDDDPALVWSFAGSEPAGSFDAADLVLIVQWGDRAGERGEFTRVASEGALVVSSVALTVTWSPTINDFAIIPRSAAIRYELKRLAAGKTRTLAWGETRIESGLLRDPTEDTSPAGQGYTDIRLAALRSELLAEIAAIEPGQGGGGEVKVFTQATPAATWTIPHGFGRRPLTAVFDAAGNEMIADIAAGAATVTVTFAQPTAGSAVLA